MTIATGNNSGGYLITNSKKLLLYVGISYVSIANAK
jgi:hypothetical protein